MLTRGTNVIDGWMDGQTDDVRWQYHSILQLRGTKNLLWRMNSLYTTLILIKVISAKRSYTEPSNYIYYNIDENFDNEKIYRNRIGFKFKLSHSLGLSDVTQAGKTCGYRCWGIAKAKYKRMSHLLIADWLWRSVSILLLLVSLCGALSQLGMAFSWWDFAIDLPPATQPIMGNCSIYWS